VVVVLRVAVAVDVAADLVDLQRAGLLRNSKRLATKGTKST